MIILLSKNLKPNTNTKIICFDDQSLTILIFLSYNDLVNSTSCAKIRRLSNLENIQVWKVQLT